MSTIKLTYNTLSLTLGIPGRSPFTEFSFPRERIELPSFGRTPSGAVTKEGTSYEAPFTWNLSAKLLPEDAALLQRIFDLWLLDGATSYLRLHDLIKPINERGDRSRALADSAPSQEISGSGATAIRRYFAAFNALFVGEPKAVESGDREIVTFTLIEGVKLAP